MATFNVNSQSNVTVTATDDADTINLQGTGSNILINALAGADTIVGGEGAVYTAATVFGGLGSDSLGGGLSSFSLIFGNQGADTINLTTGGSRLTVYGGQDDDQLTVANGGSQQLVFGNQGSDTITLQNVGTGSSVYGGQGDDLIQAGDFGFGPGSFTSGGSQLLSGDLGNDTVVSFGNRDTLLGGQGQDTLAFVVGNNGLLNGNADDDEIFLLLASGTTVFGGQGSDTINVVGSGDFDGGPGFPFGSDSNLVFGNLGDDTINLSGVVGTTVYGGQGADIITIDGEPSDDPNGPGFPFFAPSSNTVVYGDLGNDIITVGAAEATTVFGGQGNDRITGTDVADVFDGGAGNDIFVATGTNTDGGDEALRIENFVSGQDLVALSADTPATNANYAEAQVVGGLEAARAAVSGPNGLGEGEYRFVAGTSDGYLFFGDANTVVELAGLNSIDLFAATDITLGAGVPQQPNNGGPRA